MNYFDQISHNNFDNLRLLLTKDGNSTEDLNKKIVFKKHVEIVNMELSYQCNRKCDYCPVRESNRRTEQNHMNNEIFEKIISNLTEIRYENRISLNLYNEPMMDSKLYERINYIKNRLPYSHIGFNSNGDYLNDKTLSSLSDSGLDYICITLHPQPNKNQDGPVIIRRITKMLQKINYVFDEKPIDQKFIADNEFLIINKNGVKVKIQWPNWRQFGTNRAGTLAELNTKSIRVEPCIKPFREFTIYHNGIVQPCCESYLDDNQNLFEVGDLKINNIFDIYLSSKLSAFRRHVFDFGEKSGICASCSAKDYSTDNDDISRKSILKAING
jgi:MoaA/NifB/PqqE/SkfB family radical SAM enzyme